MTTRVTGINTGAVLNENKFFALALRFRQNDASEQVIYMQPGVLKDFMLILHHRLQGVLKNYEQQGETYKQRMIAENETFTKNTPDMQSEDVQNPDANKRIVTLTLKEAHEGFRLICTLPGEQLLILNFDDSQAEFTLHAIVQALNNANDQAMATQLLNTLDFLTTYDIDLSNAPNVNYHQYSHEAWKQHLFSRYICVLYGFDTEKGKALLAGAIIKCNKDEESEEVQQIVQRFYLLNPHFAELRNTYPNAHFFCKTIPTQERQILSLEESMGALKEFYQNLSPQLNSH